jgi:hypothetical protein
MVLTDLLWWCWCARVCLQGMLEAVDKELIRKGAKGKVRRSSSSSSRSAHLFCCVVLGNSVPFARAAEVTHAVRRSRSPCAPPMCLHHACLFSCMYSQMLHACCLRFVLLRHAYLMVCRCCVLMCDVPDAGHLGVILFATDSGAASTCVSVLCRTAQ